jgi:hypothetical protein
MGSSRRGTVPILRRQAVRCSVTWIRAITPLLAGFLTALGRRVLRRVLPGRGTGPQYCEAVCRARSPPRPLQGCLAEQRACWGTRQVVRDAGDCALDITLTNTPIYKIFYNSAGVGMVRQQAQAIQLMTGQPGQPGAPAAPPVPTSPQPPLNRAARRRMQKGH